METSMDRVVSCFSVPLHGYGNRLIGVLALDIDTELFRTKCREVGAAVGATVTIDELQPFEEEMDESDNEDDICIQHKIERNGWTVTVTTPMSTIMGGVHRMQRRMMYIGALGLLLMIGCFLILFQHTQRITTEKAGMESEVRVASAIQMSMIPKTYPAFPNCPKLDVYGMVLPAKSVGGDLYDYLIRDDKFYFCIGDVSGKGIPASLFMAVTRALFRNLSSESDDPAYILQRMNDVLTDGNEMNMFCTLFLGILDLNTGHVSFCNAGHNAPIIRRLKEAAVDVHYLAPHTNLALGVMAGFPYEAEQLDLAAGEAIFLYTDGVTEAENHRHELFGEQTLLKALQNIRHHGERSPEHFVQGVYAQIKKHADGAEQSDDITMLVVEYVGTQNV